MFLRDMIVLRTPDTCITALYSYFSCVHSSIMTIVVIAINNAIVFIFDLLKISFSHDIFSLKVSHCQYLVNLFIAITFLFIKCFNFVLN